MANQTQADDRGVSDVMGFVLVFGLILVSVSIVYVTGFDSLTTAQEREELRNVERAYDILADNIQSVTRGDAPVRNTQLRLGTAEMTSGNPVTFTVFVRDESNGHELVDMPAGETDLPAADEWDDYEFPRVAVTPIEYVTTGGSSVRYENGAIFRSVPGGETLVSPPPVYTDVATVDASGNPQTHNLLFPFIHTRPADGIVGVSGGTVNIRTASTGSETITYHTTDEGGPYTVKVIIDSERPDVWERYCRNSDAFQAEYVGDETDMVEDGVVDYPDENRVGCAANNIETFTLQYNSLDVRYDT